jgi:hypothetical protein
MDFLEVIRSLNNLDFVTFSKEEVEEVPTAIVNVSHI